MDWTWAFDDYVGAALALGTMAGVLVALLWWAAGGIWLCRRWGTRTAILLPLGLALGLGWMDEPLLASTLFISWLAAEVVVPQALQVRWGRGSGKPSPAAIFAAAGSLACLGAFIRGPLGLLGSFFFGRLGQLALLCTLLAAALSAGALRRRLIASPVLRAATSVALVLAWDGMHLTRGGWTIYLLGLPMLYELALALRAAVRNGGPADRRRLAAAAVWALALAGLVAHSRLNLQLSAQRSAEVIAACRGYETDHGRLPSELGDLVPSYLPRVPHADWSLLGDFRYTAGDSPQLSYFAPWPDAVVYRFEEDEWRISPGVGLPWAQSASKPAGENPVGVRPRRQNGFDTRAYSVDHTATGAGQTKGRQVHIGRNEESSRGAGHHPPRGQPDGEGPSEEGKPRDVRVSGALGRAGKGGRSPVPSRRPQDPPASPLDLADTRPDRGE